ncbi:helix-turn-helix domain-containing protein [Streptomyces sp. 35G-GA-8]|uniref:helix-turn-helix domain-containing protein n=1 Tax=Streptomyces sp. 35G-GA-8 TaxID=2939434 RepID=UPI0035B1A8D3
MQHSPNGRPISGKSLGERVGLSKSKISALLHEERATVTRETADDIAEILGVHTGALFFEPLPTPVGVGNHGKGRDDHQRALPANAARRAQELGQHPRQGEPDGRRP